MQKHTISVLIIGALLGGFTTYALLLQTGVIEYDDDAHTHSHADGDHDHAHDHDHGEELDVDSASAPVLSIESTRISGGNNIDINVSWENFRVAPENADSEHVDGEGHLHIYVNGEKIGRMYSNWHHIYDLEPGEYEIEVTATTNDHRLYTTDGEEVAATATVTIQ